MLQRVINENLYNKKANVTKEERNMYSMKSEFNEFKKDKVLIEAKKLANKYGYELEYNRVGFNSNNNDLINIYFTSSGRYHCNIEYDNNEKDYIVHIPVSGNVNLSDTKLLNKNISNALEFIEKIKKLDLINNGPILTY